MFRAIPLVLSTLAGLPLRGAETPPFLTVRELHDRFIAPEPATGCFLTTATVEFVNSRSPEQSYYIVADGTGRTVVRFGPAPAMEPGNVLELVCRKESCADGDKRMQVKNYRRLGEAPLPQPLPIALADLDERRHDLATVVTEGEVVDIVPDEVDANFTVLLLKDRHRTIPCFVGKAAARLVKDGLLDARIRLTGRYHRLVSGQRRYSGPYLDNLEQMTIVEPPQANRIDVPPLDPCAFMTPRDLAEMDRRSMLGRVLATWNGKHLMLRVTNQVVNATLAKGVAAPRPGDVVKVSGYPGTDLYRLHLRQAVWREDPTPLPAEAAPEPILPETILFGPEKRGEIKSPFHGKLVRLEGLIRHLPDPAGPEKKFNLDTGAFQVPVDFSDSPAAVDGLEPGSRIGVTGYCRLESPVSGQYEIFPQISGFSVVLRRAGDIELLARPTWWTPGRLVAAFAVLVAALLAILVWNRMLHLLVARRGKQLFRAEVDNAKSALRVEERTLLAVELHDALSQNLTGVALEIDIAIRKATVNLPQALEHLALAQMTLKSCREELRYCLWDLRNNALGAKTMDEAIRQTLAPQIGEARLSVRFGIPRKEISDNTAHTILSVVRELAANAVRHGRARNLRVAGTREGGAVRFAVADDGAGFDTANVAGVLQGHFGLQGIRERIAALGGRFEIHSTPGEGTRAICTLGVLAPANKEKPCPSAS